MQWQDEGLVLSTRPHGETSAVLEVLTKSHGRYLGLVKGGRAKAKQPWLQAGNHLSLTWSARLEEHLGQFSIEPLKLRTQDLITYKPALYAMNYLVSLLRLLPERDPHNGLYYALEVVMENLHDIRLFAPLIVRYELLTLQELGFRLDFSECAATGAREELIYVSPKSARAVCANAGEPYKHLLLKLPAFCAGPSALPNHQELLEGFKLTGFFLERDIYLPRNLKSPPIRESLLALV